MINKTILSILVLSASLSQAVTIEDNNIIFNFTDNTTIVDISLTKNDAILKATDNVCSDGVTTANQAANGNVHGKYQCVVSSDLNLTNNTLTYKSGRSSNEDIGTIMQSFVTYGSAMNSYSNPFTTTFNSTCQVTEVNNTLPKELYFMMNVNLTASVNDKNITCENLMIAMHGNSVTYKGLKQLAVTASKDGNSSYAAGKKVYDDPKSKDSWSAMGKSVYSDVKDSIKLDSEIKAVDRNTWWIMPTSTDDKAFTLQPYYGPTWLTLTNQNFKNALQCSDNYTLFVTYSDNNSSADTFFMQFLESDGEDSKRQ